MYIRIYIKIIRNFGSSDRIVGFIGSDRIGSSPITIINIGASPELELALGTLCFVARPDVPCTVQGSDGAQYTMTVRTVTYNAVKYVETSHPTESL